MGAAIAQVISQTVAEHDVEVDIRQVDVGMGADAIVGTELPRAVDTDAVIWGFGGVDIDSPSPPDVFAIAARLKA